MVRGCCRSQNAVATSCIWMYITTLFLQILVISTRTTAFYIHGPTLSPSSTTFLSKQHTSRSSRANAVSPSFSYLSGLNSNNNNSSSNTNGPKKTSSGLSSQQSGSDQDGNEQGNLPPGGNTNNENGSDNNISNRDEQSLPGNDMQDVKDLSKQQPSDLPRSEIPGETSQPLSNIQQEGPTAPTTPEKEPVVQEEQKPVSIWDTSAPKVVQGGCLRTWSFDRPVLKRAQVFLKTEGRPLNANVELWQGPDNAPQVMEIYIEDGGSCPFSAVLETPGAGNAVAVYNTGQLEFPLDACVVESDLQTPGTEVAREKARQDMNNEGSSAGTKIIQGGALRTFPFDPNVASVLVALQTNGRPLNAVIELLQGPDNMKQLYKVYTEDGMTRPFVSVLVTPGSGNVLRIINTATVEFPLTATVAVFRYETS